MLHWNLKTHKSLVSKKNRQEFHIQDLTTRYPCPLISQFLIKVVHFHCASFESNNQVYFIISMVEESILQEGKIKILQSSHPASKLMAQTQNTLFKSWSFTLSLFHNSSMNKHHPLLEAYKNWFFNFQNHKTSTTKYTVLTILLFFPESKHNNNTQGILWWK